MPLDVEGVVIFNGAPVIAEHLPQAVENSLRNQSPVDDGFKWLKARQNYVTASEVATLMGRSSYSGLYRLAHEKMGLLDNTERDETNRNE